MPSKSVTPYFRYWRTTIVMDREVIDAVVSASHRGPSDQLRRALDAWPGTYYWSDRESPDRLVLIRATRSAPRERWWFHTLLFVMTFGTVWMAGAMLIGPSVRISAVFGVAPADLWSSISGWATQAVPAFGFAAALMGVLLTHEMGHYVVAKRYHINASPPFFLPAPPQINFIGTFGAFIRLRSPVVDRRQLLDVGAAGPWAGFVISVLALAFGLAHSNAAPDLIGETRQFIYIHNSPFFLGDSFFMTWMRLAVAGEHTVELHPMALAGWFGLFVTTLNLLPLGQLDGGHIVYALIGRHQAKVGLLMWYGLIVLGFQFWGWWLWAALILILGRGRLAHPSVMEPHRPVPWSRWPFGLATAILFVVTFTPNPLPSLL